MVVLAKTGVAWARSLLASLPRNSGLLVNSMSPVMTAAAAAAAAAGDAGGFDTSPEPVLGLAGGFFETEPTRVSLLDGGGGAGRVVVVGVEVEVMSVTAVASGVACPGNLTTVAATAATEVASSVGDEAGDDEPETAATGSNVAFLRVTVALRIIVGASLVAGSVSIAFADAGDTLSALALTVADGNVATNFFSPRAMR